MANAYYEENRQIAYDYYKSNINLNGYTFVSARLYEEKELIEKLGSSGVYHFYLQTYFKKCTGVHAKYWRLDTSKVRVYQV